MDLSLVGGDHRGASGGAQTCILCVHSLLLPLLVEDLFGVCLEVAIDEIELVVGEMLGKH